MTGRITTARTLDVFIGPTRKVHDCASFAAILGKPKAFISICTFLPMHPVLYMVVSHGGRKEEYAQASMVRGIYIRGVSFHVPHKDWRFGIVLIAVYQTKNEENDRMLSLFCWEANPVYCSYPSSFIAGDGDDEQQWRFVWSEV